MRNVNIKTCSYSAFFRIMVIVLSMTMTLSMWADTKTKSGRKVADRHLEIQQYIEIMGNTLIALNGYYVDSINWDRAFTAGLDAMLSELDPYCEFYNESDQDDFKTMTTGEYGGIGSLIQQRGDTVLIANPYKGRPAQQAGLRVGDAILKIDSLDMLHKTTADVSDKLRGTAGTTFQITVKRPGVEEPLVIPVTRRKIQLDAVQYYGWLNDSTAYINLNQFTDKAASDVQNALTDLRASTEGKLKGLVLDLRANPGGLMDEAVKILGLFIPKGKTVVETKAKISMLNRQYTTQTVPIEPDIRIVCLINRSSASAAEIVSGALQDLDRAVIMGERSYGKGLVQTTRQMPYNTMVKFTISKYYIPSGRCIQAIDYNHEGKGIDYRIPDSLTHVFKTANGREVRDGGGIKPDVEKKPELVSNLYVYTKREYLVHDFANAYCLKHNEIPAIKDFHITDEDYEDFKNLVITTRKDSILNLLKIDNLEHHLDSLKTEQCEQIENEIVLRYYMEAGQWEQTVMHDKLIHDAADLICDVKRYNGILGKETPMKPGKKSKNKKK